MRLLTNQNTVYTIESLPEELDDLRFCVFDNSVPNDADYYWIPLIWLESFLSPMIKMQIGKHEIIMPIDWQILVGEPGHGDLELLPLTSINDRGFNAFVFNPISGFRPEYLEVEVLDVFTDTRWFSPRVRPGQLICIPLTDSPSPPCAYFIKEISKFNEVVKINQAW